ncbi:MAG: leucyl aminopeptidase [Parvularcula sp.]
MKIRFDSAIPHTGAILVPVPENSFDQGAFGDVDKETGGALMRAARAAEFSGKAGQSLTVPAPGEWDDGVVILLGLGTPADLSAQDAVKLGGRAIAAVKDQTTAALVLGDLAIAGVSGGALAADAAFGGVLRRYDFDIYRKKTAKPDEKKVEAFTVVTSAAGDAKAAFADREAVAAGMKMARDLVSEPPNVLYPESYAERCKELESLGVKVTILDEAKMAELGMGSLLGVGQGSVRGSRLAVMEWQGGKAGDAPVAFVGKGVTFDTGGISLKPGAGMEDMKFDMGGSAAVVGAVHALAARKAKANVVGLVGLVENMPDGNAQRPSDIVTSMSGQTIEVLNTDAEGRLVLADVLTYAQETYKPKAMVDLATLTGAILISLADVYAGLFTKKDAFAEQLLLAGKETGEELWRMPLGKAHDEMIKSDIADMKNIGGRDGGSSSAAAFLARFVDEDLDWAHLDIAGTAWTKKDRDTCPKGATGFGVRLLDAFIRDNYEG